MSDLRPYQIEAYDATFKALSRGVTKQLLSLATGTGKTKLAVNILNKFDKKLFTCHTEELAEQSAVALLSELNLMTKDELNETLQNNNGLIELLRNNSNNMFADWKVKCIVDNIGIVKADLFDISKPITIASMQTLWRRLDRIPDNHFDAIVIDECHMGGAKSWAMSINYFKPKLTLGLSATPTRMDGMLLGDVFDEIVYNYPIDKAIEDGYLCEIDAIRVKTESELDTVKTTAGDLNQKDLEVIVNTPKRNQLIVDKYKEYASGRQFIAFCVDVQHAMDLNATFVENGIKSNFIVGNKDLTPDRRNVIDMFKKGEYVGLTNCMVLTAGFDHPNTGCVIMAAPTKSLTKYIQQVGRGTRLKDELFVSRFKQQVIVLDIVDITSKHRLINTWTLDKGKRLEEKTFITKQKKLDLIAQRDIKMKIAPLKKDTRVNLLKLPKIEISNSIRMQEEATEKQLAWIAKLGYDVINTNYTKAMCSEIITALPATDAQVWRLSKEGYDVSNGVTMSEAKEAFRQIDERKEREAAAKVLKNNSFPFTDLK